MVITFNYKDDTETIVFDDLKVALAKHNTGSDLDCTGAPQWMMVCNLNIFSGMSRLPINFLRYSAIFTRNVKKHKRKTYGHSILQILMFFHSYFKSYYRMIFVSIQLFLLQGRENEL